MAFSREQLLETVAAVGLQQAIAAGAFDQPLLPLDRNIAIFGDSRTANTTSGSAPSEIIEVYGYASWFCQYTNGRVKVSAARNGGVGGDTTAQWLARVPTIIAYGAKVVVILIGTNDRGAANYSLATSKSNIEAGVRQIIEAGIIPVVIAETPRGGANALTGQQLQNHLDLRDWMRTYLPTIGVRVVDVWQALISENPTEAAAGLPKAGVMHDGLHLSPVGARIVGKEVSQVLIDLFPTKLALPLYDSPYVATANVRGNLNTNPLCTGTTGTKSGSANATGDVATGWTLSGSSWTGAKVTASKESNVAAGEFQVLEVSGMPTGSGSFLSFEQTLSLANLTNGDKIKAVAQISHEGLEGVAGVSLDLRIVRSAQAQNVKHCDRYTEVFPLDGELVVGPHETPIWTYASATDTEIKIRLVIYGCQNIPLKGKIKIGQIACVKTP